MDYKNNNTTIGNNKSENKDVKKERPIKIIKTNRAECHHMKDDDDNFNLFDHLEDDFFSSEKALRMRKEDNLRNEKNRDKIFVNFMPAVKCLKRMTDAIEEEKNKNLNLNNESNTNIIKKKINNGLLYEFFYSDKFNIDSLIIQLNKQSKPSIIDTLIELVYQKYINESLFYLPQLCMLFNYKEYYSSIKSYLLDRCVDQIKFSLQITWLLNSFIEDDSPLIKGDVYEWLLQKIEETLVNGERNTIKLFNQYKELEKEESNDVNINIINRRYSHDYDNLKNYEYHKEISMNSEMLPFLEKQSRLLYFNICNEFYSSLKYMCEDLKNYPKENDQRKNKLMEYIKDFNQNFIQQRIENEEYLLNYPSFFGIILPFNDSSSTEDLDSSLIVRIIPEECFCFSTKARVPTKICAECITVKELKNSEYLNINQIQNKKQNNKSKNKNALFKSFTYIENDNDNDNLNINNHVNAFQTKRSQRIRQYSLMGKKVKSFNNLENNTTQTNGEKKENDKGEKLRNFLYNINKTIEEENALKLTKKNTIKNEEEKKNIENETTNELIDEFEILPDISEDLKNVFGKPMDGIKKEIQQNSPFKKFKSYKLINFIAKANDDLRQELLAMQLIKFFDKVFKQENISLHLRPYEILITSSSSGLLEFLQNTSSIDGIKKKMTTTNKSLYIFYKNYFKENFEEAQINFARSLAAYSLVCYYLQIKDRHNGNILIDMAGNIIHIDFGFILGIAPGGINFENAPFKFTKEYLEIMGGKDSLYYQMFKDLMIKGMIACKKYADNFINIAEIMSKGSKMPCFDNKNTSDIFYKFRERFYVDKKDEDFIKIVDDLINWSYDNFRTNQYDNYQKLTNGILP